MQDMEKKRKCEIEKDYYRIMYDLLSCEVIRALRILQESNTENAKKAIEILKEGLNRAEGVYKDSV